MDVKLIERLRNRDTRYARLPEPADPYAMVFVVNDNKSLILNRNDVIVAVARATVEMIIAEEHSFQVDAWLDQRIRKLVKRGRNKAWDDLEPLPYIEQVENNAEVKVFPPYKLSEVPAEIRKLQLTGLVTVDEPVEKVLDPNTLVISFNPHVELSTGKAAAQAGHAAQLFVMKAPIEKVDGWFNAGKPIAIVNSPDFDDTDFDIEVHDAGFTEIPAGTRTAIAKLV